MWETGTRESGTRTRGWNSDIEGGEGRRGLFPDHLGEDLQRLVVVPISRVRGCQIELQRVVWRCVPQISDSRRVSLLLDQRLGQTIKRRNGLCVYPQRCFELLDRGIGFIMLSGRSTQGGVRLPQFGLQVHCGSEFASGVVRIATLQIRETKVIVRPPRGRLQPER